MQAVNQILGKFLNIFVLVNLASPIYSFCPCVYCGSGITIAFTCPSIIMIMLLYCTMICFKICVSVATFELIEHLTMSTNAVCNCFSKNISFIPRYSYYISTRLVQHCAWYVIDSFMAKSQELASVVFSIWLLINFLKNILV